MALISCPECGKQISDRAKACPHCGCPMSRTLYKEYQSEPSSNKKPTQLRKKNIIFAIVIVTILVMSGIIYFTSFFPYDYGKSLLEKGRYQEAIEQFTKISITYKDTQSLILEAKYQLALQQIERKEYLPALNILEEISDKKEVTSEINQISYNQAVRLYKDGNFSEALNYLSKIEAGYLDADKYKSDCESLNNLQGEWMLYGRRTKDGWVEEMDRTMGYRFDGWKVTIVIGRDYFGTSQNSYTYELDGKHIEWNSGGDTGVDFDMQIESSESLVVYYNGEKGREFKKDSSGFIIYDKPQHLMPPKIGMTENEVLMSAWGTPQDINKTTTGYGTREQWVYSGYRYVYFEDGIVTAIQE